jgi:hypothetical protein
MSNAIVTSSTTPDTPSTDTRTASTATISAPVIAVRYQLSFDGTSVMDLTTSISLGSLDVDGSYVAKPIQGP